MDFSKELRTRTRQQHSVSDTLVNSKLLLALSDESVWADALLSFYEIFKYLEASRDDVPELSLIIYDKKFLRTRAFEKDLVKYLGPEWKKSYYPRKEVVEYLQHLDELKEERPLLLLAYAYHLYLGLLSGGQVIRKKREFKEMTLKSLYYPRNSGDLNEKDVVTDFSDVNIPEAKQTMKDAINKLASTWTQEQRCALINESQMVFVYNNTLVKSVRGTNRALMWKLVYAFVVVNLSVLLYYYFK